MIVRLAVITTMIALFGFSFSVLVDNTRQRILAVPTRQPQGARDCLSDRLLCSSTPRNAQLSPVPPRLPRVAEPVYRES